MSGRILQVAGEQIETTAEHPFYVSGLGWVEARLLRAGDLLVGEDGALLRVELVDWLNSPVAVYDFEVNGLHNYFVGAEEILVHNCVTGLSDAQKQQLIDALSGTKFEADAKKIVEGIGTYKGGDKVLGHHIHMKSAFEPSGHDAMLTISEEALSLMGAKHLFAKSVTSVQFRLARTLAKIVKSTGNSAFGLRMRSHDIIAYVSLKANGVPPNVASLLVEFSKQQLVKIEKAGMITQATPVMVPFI